MTALLASLVWAPLLYVAVQLAAAVRLLMGTDPRSLWIPLGVVVVALMILTGAGLLVFSVVDAVRVL